MDHRESNNHVVGANNMKYFLLMTLMIVTTSLLTMANPPSPAPAPPPPPTEEEISPEIIESQKNVLTEIIKPLLWELDRNILTFHYESQKDKNVPENWSQVQDHIMRYPGRFFDASYKDSNMIGPGLYVAIDPLASRGFGGNNPLLYTVQLKKGAHMLLGECNLSSGGSSNKDLEAIWNTLKCNSNSRSPIWGLSDLIGKMRNSESLHCRKFIIDIIQNLQIEAIQYGYTAANGFSGSCRSDRGFAFSIIKANALASEGMNFYANDFKLEKQKLTPLLNLLYSESAQDLKLLRWNDSAEEMVGSLQKSNTAPLLLFDLWRNKMIFQCGPKWISEKLYDRDLDKNLGDIVKKYYKITKTFEDREFMKTTIAAKKMVKKKYMDDPKNVSTYFFDYGRLKKWTLLSMEVAGEDLNNPTAVTNWIAAFSILHTYNNSDLPKVVALLNEDPSKIPAPEALQQKLQNLLLESLGKSDSKTSLLINYAKGMEDLGFGPRFILAHLQFQLMDSYFTAPIVTGDLSDGLASLFTEANLQLSLEASKEVLVKCMDIYGDPNIKYDQILAGSCGFQ